MSGFKLARSSGGSDIPRKGQLKPGYTYLAGDAVYFDTTGKLAHVTAAVTAAGILVNGAVVAAEDITEGLYIPSLRGVNEFRADLSLGLEGTVCVSNATDTIVKYTVAAGTDDDMVGGYVRCPATGERRLITANAYSGGFNSLTVVESFATALTTGDVVDILPHGPYHTAVKFQASSPQRGVSTLVAGATGGKLSCIEIANDLSYGIYSILP